MKSLIPGIAVFALAVILMAFGKQILIGGAVLVIGLVAVGWLNFYARKNPTTALGAVWARVIGATDVGVNAIKKTAPAAAVKTHLKQAGQNLADDAAALARYSSQMDELDVEIQQREASVEELTQFLDAEIAVIERLAQDDPQRQDREAFAAEKAAERQRLKNEVEAMRTQLTEVQNEYSGAMGRLEATQSELVAYEQSLERQERNEATLELQERMNSAASSLLGRTTSGTQASVAAIKEGLAEHNRQLAERRARLAIDKKLASGGRGDKPDYLADFRAKQGANKSQADLAAFKAERAQAQAAEESEQNEGTTDTSS